MLVVLLVLCFGSEFQCLGHKESQLSVLLMWIGIRSNWLCRNFVCLLGLCLFGLCELEVEWKWVCDLSAYYLKGGTIDD